MITICIVLRTELIVQIWSLCVNSTGLTDRQPFHFLLYAYPVHEGFGVLSLRGPFILNYIIDDLCPCQPFVALEGTGSLHYTSG